MASVLFIAVREDIERAETLADMFEMSGVSVISPFNEQTLEACDAAILVWSRASARSTAFLNAADRALACGKVVSACLAGAPSSVLDGPMAFDLAKWRGAPDSDVLDDFFYAAYAKLMALQQSTTAQADLDGEAEPIALLAEAPPPSAGPLVIDADYVDVDAMGAAYLDARDHDDGVTPSRALGPGWSGDLPETPLSTFTAKRYTPRAKPRRGIFHSVLRTVAAFVLMSAAAFAGSLARAPQQQQAQSGVTALVTQADAQGDNGAFKGVADVAPPVWLREPASAPEISDRG